MQTNSLPPEPPGKPKNTGVGSLSLLQQIVPTQDLNWGLLHCRWILYQLNYQGSPGVPEMPIVNFSEKKNVNYNKVVREKSKFRKEW